MRKRVLLSFALLLKPSVLTADDPTGGLDVTIQRQLMDLLASLQQQEGFMLVIATQDLGVVAHYADTITVLDRGQVVEHTTPMEFFSGPRSETGSRHAGPSEGVMSRVVTVERLAQGVPPRGRRTAGGRRRGLLPDRPGRGSWA